eukprot:6205136-Pleurochrysis_carterae.AAC.3
MSADQCHQRRARRWHLPSTQWRASVRACARASVRACERARVRAWACARAYACPSKRVLARARLHP